MRHRLVFLGSPGAGKGTIAQKLAIYLNIPHISTGDIFRENIKNVTQLGQQVESILASGALVPDELTIALIKERLLQKDTSKGFILDGFPRTIAQAEALNTLSDVSMVVNFVVNQHVVINRLSGRLTCPKCQRSYHKINFPPQKEHICDICGSNLITRKDDTIEAIKHRLTVYQTTNAPLIDYYRKKNLLVDLDSSQDIEHVFQSLVKSLEQSPLPLRS